jgi:cytoskeletal protein RodZ
MNGTLKASSPNPPATSAQILRQVAVIVVVVVLWSALLVGYLALTGSGDEPAPPTPLPEVVPTLSRATAPEPTAAATQTQPPASEPEATSTLPTAVSFANDVLPVFSARCERCHSGALPDAGFSVSSHADVMAGSEDGPVVIPGDAAASRLVQVIVTGQMPRRAPKLPDAEIQTISDWVDAGAPDN